MLATHIIATPTHTTAVRELPADLETPVSVYLKLAGNGPSFLLESVTGGEQVARYSFIGVHPRAAYVLRGRSLETHIPGQEAEITNLPEDADPLDVLRAQIAPQMITDTSQRIPGLPRFAGGLGAEDVDGLGGPEVHAALQLEMGAMPNSWVPRA